MHASSISCEVISRGGSDSTSTSLRPSTSPASSTSPGRRSKRPRLSFSPERLHGAGLQRGDAVDGDEQLAPADPGLQPGHGRIAAVGQAHDQVLDPAEPLARTVEQRASKD